eukprot:PITA_18916
MGFIKSDTDPNLCYLMVEGEPLILVLYVDDPFLTGSLGIIEDCKRNLVAKFDTKDLGLMHYFLLPRPGGMAERWRDLPWSREIYYKDSEEIQDARLLDIWFAVNTLSQFMVGPKRVHWKTMRHLLRYLCDTVEYGLRYTRGVVSWRSRKLKSVVPSSAEAEYMEANIATCEAIWLQKLLVSLFSQKMKVTDVYFDNQSCIRFSENLVFRDRWKHIYIQHHFIRDCVQRGAFHLQHVPIEEQVANLPTKALGRDKFIYFRE